MSNKYSARLLTSVAFAWSSLTWAAAAQTATVLPDRGVVAAGGASISSPSGTSLVITQSTPRAIINWGSFSIGSAGAVRFENGSGATLNRVTGLSKSQIDGSLSASGSVYLVNPQGVTVGPSGVVTTGGTFIASTHDITDQAFLAGGAQTFKGNSTASVINYGAIASLGGDVALIARRVESAGSITAPKGTAALAAGYEILMRDGALSDGKFLVKVGGADTEAKTSGAIKAAEVELRANGGNVYALAGNTHSLTKATGIAQVGGRIFLTAGTGGRVSASQKLVARKAETNGKSKGGEVRVVADTVQVSAQIDARGAGEKGGTITVEGRDIALTSGAHLDVSGTQGGVLLVGGDYQGGTSASVRYSQETMATAQRVVVENGAVLQADGSVGSGGKVVVWSDAKTVFAGAVQAVGADGGGDAEISGKALLDFTGSADLRGGAGRFGTLLLDPYNVTILTAADILMAGDKSMTGFTSLAENSVLSVETLQAALAKASVVVQTGPGGGEEGKIFVDAPIRWSSGSDLTLEAHRDILVYYPITASNGSRVTLAAGGGGTGGSVIVIGVVDAPFVDIYYNPLSVPGVAKYTNPRDYRDSVGSNTVLTSYMLVNNADDFKNIRNNTSAKYALSQDIGEIIINTPIYEFGGTLDGRGHSIKSIINTENDTKIIHPPGMPLIQYENIDNSFDIYADDRIVAYSESNSGNGGIFNILTPSGLIKNIVIEKLVVGGKYNVGGLVSINKGYIQNVHISADVEARINAGGLVAVNIGTIVDSSSSGKIGVSRATAGGLVGINLGNIVSSFSTADVDYLKQPGVNKYISPHKGSAWDLVTTFEPLPSYGEYFGVLVGINRSNIDRSYSNGSVASTLTVGGLVGHNAPNGKIRNSYSLSEVYGLNPGGLVGRNNSAHLTVASAALIENSYSAGVVRNFHVDQFEKHGDFRTNTYIYYNNPPIVAVSTVPNSSGEIINSYAVTTQSSSYAGFDFANVWFQTGDMKPILRSEIGAPRNGLFEIRNLNQLQLMGTKSNAQFALVADIDAQASWGPSGGRASNWGSQGFQSLDFNGQLDGRGHTISKLFISNPNADRIGLFRVLGANSQVTNLTLADASVAGRNRVGILAGETHGFVDSTSISGTVAGRSEVGGFTGWAGANARFSNSVISGEVRATGPASYGGSGAAVGGFAGVGEGQFLRVTSKAQVSGARGVGGIVGHHVAGRVEDSQASGTIRAERAGGGIAGWSAGDIVRSTASASITELSTSISNMSRGFLGGLVGHMFGKGSVSDSSASGSVTGSGIVGGLVGFIDTENSVWRSSASGTVTAATGSGGGLAGDNNGLVSQSSASGLVRGLTTLGGLVGWNGDRGRIISSSATGAVTGDGSASNGDAGAAIGGLVGGSRGVIDASSASGTVMGYRGVGGLVGHLLAGTVSRSEARGAVSAERAGGGLVGWSAGAVIDSRAFGNVSERSTAITGMGRGALGGLIGHMFDSGSVLSSQARGAVTGTAQIGGLVGFVGRDNSIQHSAASGGVTATNGSGGGLAGDNNGRIYSSSASGEVRGLQTLGGLVGWNGDTGRIISSNAWGSVAGDGPASNGESGAAIGGLVGGSRGQIDTSAASGNVMGYRGVGGLVGHLIAGTVSQSEARGSVLAERAGGGLAGWSGGTIVDSVAFGKVSERSTSVTGMLHGALGGLVGHMFDAGSIRSSRAMGAVTGSFQIGGLVGFMGEKNSIESSSAVGFVTATNGHGGGLVGSSNGRIASSTAQGGVKGLTVLGGLVGWSGAASSIANSSASGLVTGEGPASNALAGAAIGGLVGHSEGHIVGNSATGDVRGYRGVGGLVGHQVAGGIVSSTASGRVFAERAGGGLVGWSGGFIGGSSATGAVLEIGSTMSGMSHGLMGGLVGHQFGDGIIQDSRASGRVAGTYGIGGLVGYAYGAAIQHSNAAGEVSGTDSVGGLVGYNHGLVETSWTQGSVSGQIKVGGLTGVNDGRIIRSSAFATVRGDVEVGGLAGAGTGAIRESYAGGSVSGKSQVGPVAGSTYNGSVIDTYFSTALTGHISGWGWGIAGAGLTNPANYPGWNPTSWTWTAQGPRPL